MDEEQLEFFATLALIKNGNVTEEKLDAASTYANDALKETVGLLSALLDGFKVLQAELIQKDQAIEERNRRIHNLSELLAETNRRYQAAKADLQEERRKRRITA